MSKWIKCSDRLPTIGTRVIVYAPLRFTDTAYWNGQEWIRRGLRPENKKIVTHWMPLPQPSKEEL